MLDVWNKLFHLSHLQACLAFSPFHANTETLVDMNSEVNAFENQVQSMRQKINVWAQNVYKMEGKQGVLRLRLIELGVDVDKFSDGGSILPGFQEFTTPAVPPEKGKNCSYGYCVST